MPFLICQDAWWQVLVGIFYALVTDLLCVFQDYIDAHPETIVLDPLPAIRTLLDRCKSYQLIHRIESCMKGKTFCIARWHLHLPVLHVWWHFDTKSQCWPVTQLILKTKGRATPTFSSGCCNVDYLALDLAPLTFEEAKRTRRPKWGRCDISYVTLYDFTYCTMQSALWGRSRQIHLLWLFSLCRELFILEAMTANCKSYPAVNPILRKLLRMF